MNIFCPTDLTVASHAAFQHGLSLTLAYRGNLTLLHVPATSEAPSGFPGVRAQLEKWQRIPAHSRESAVADLGITVEKIVGRQGDPLDITLHYLEHHQADLIVLSTHQRDGRSRWLGRAVAEPLARKSSSMTLFLPNGLGRFISPENGAPRLNRILLPICLHPSPLPAWQAVVDLLTTCGLVGTSITLLHVGAAADAPALPTGAQNAGIGLHQEVRTGDPVEQILAVAAEIKADLVVMATAGHHGFLDALRGSTTERVLRRLTCPLLAVPTTPAATD
jgi:nucleotide-binding universal stress UspA family protein